MKPKITGIIIAKNEEEMIEDCLKNLLFCDEVLVIDNGSVDKTLEIAKKNGATVFEMKTDDFSELRNKGRELAKNEWILYVDADERLDSDLKTDILKKIQINEYSAFMLKRKNYFLGKESPKIEKIIRFFYKDKLALWQGELHESPKFTGETGELSGYLLHYTHRDISKMLDKTNEWSEIEARNRFKSGHPKMTWWRFIRVVISQFFRVYILDKNYKMGTAGLIESIYQSYSIFITYSKLWELQRQK